MIVFALYEDGKQPKMELIVYLLHTVLCVTASF